jgi:DNA-binding NtrC family response regulator
LIVVEDPEIRRAAVEAALAVFVDAESSEGLADLRGALERRPVSVVVVGGGLPAGRLDGLLASVRAIRPDAAIVVVGDRADDERLLEAGAFDVLQPPVDAAALGRALRRAAHEHEILEELHRLRSRRSRPSPLDPIVGRSEPMAVLRERLGAVAARDDAVLLIGERGSGRELGARTLHALSPRRGEPFVRVDCALLGEADSGPEDDEWAADALDRAGGGTVFLGGVDRLPRCRQRKLLDALSGAGGRGAARLAASAASDLERQSRDGGFDAALRALLAREVLRVPPLRERGRDIVLIARHHVESVCAMNGLPVAQIAPATVSLLERYAWPGNVRELRETMERALTLATRGVLQPDHLPETLRESVGGGGDESAASAPRRFRDAKRRVVDSFEKSYLEELLAWHRGNVTAAAEQAGMLRSALQRLLRKHDLHSSDYRRGVRTMQDTLGETPS